MPSLLEGSVGLLGGTFNPIHVGHLRMAIEVRESLGLERVDLVPAKVPPHKTGHDLLDYGLRLELAREAVENVNGLGVCAIEGDLPEPSYSHATLERLQTLSPDTNYVFLLGGGDLLTLPQWRRGLEIPCMTDMAVVERDDVGWSALALFLRRHWECEQLADNVFRLRGGRRIFFVPIPRMDISASLVRKRFCQGREIRGLVPDAVWRRMKAGPDLFRQRWSL